MRDEFGVHKVQNVQPIITRARGHAGRTSAASNHMPNTYSAGVKSATKSSKDEESEHVFISASRRRSLLAESRMQRLAIESESRLQSRAPCSREKPVAGPFYEAESPSDNEPLIRMHSNSSQRKLQMLSNSKVMV